MKRLAYVTLIPLALGLALPSIGGTPATHTAAKPKAKKVVPAKPDAGKLALGLAPLDVQTSTDTLTADEQAFVRKVNDEREKRGLILLQIDPVLVKASRQHSREMSDLDYFDHFGPVKAMRTPLDRYGVALGNKKFTCTVGENLFYSTVRDIELGHTSLMKSPGHRANILADDYRFIGVGVYLADDGQYYVTEMFHT